MPAIFFPLFLVSLIGVLAASGFHPAGADLHWPGLAAGLLPLALYHLVLRRKPLLSPNEVDSVYYFGFLVTVITLVATAISIGLAESLPPLRWILLQFGLGLIATGYALFARLHLLSRSTSQKEMDVVHASVKLAKSIERVAGEMDKAGYQVTALIEQTEKRLADMEGKASARYAAVGSAFEQQLVTAMAAFGVELANARARSVDQANEAITRATDQFAAGISAVADELGRIRDEAAGTSFTRAADAIEALGSHLQRSVGTTIAKVSQASADGALAISGLEELARSARQASEQIRGATLAASIQAAWQPGQAAFALSAGKPNQP